MSTDERKNHWLRRLLSGALVSCLSLGFVGILIVLGVFVYYTPKLPDYRHIGEYKPAVMSRLYTSDGRLLEEYGTQKRVYVPLTSMPPRVWQAFLSAEDQRYFDHIGLDYVGITRAAITNFRNMGKGQRLVGGSTITQQVVKNLITGGEQSYERKIKEAILALKVNQHFSKSYVLEVYLNEIYLGGGAHGVAAAAQKYFDKSVRQLTLAEAALLAAMPKAPSLYDPRRNMERAQERRDWVLRRMRDDQYITEKERTVAAAQPIELRQRRDHTVFRADVFAEEVRRELSQLYGNEKVYESGLSVLTTLNPELQSIAENALEKGLVAYDQRYGYRGVLKTLSDLSNWRAALESFVSPVPTGNWKVAVVLERNAEVARLGIADGKVGLLPFRHASWAGKWRKARKGRRAPKANRMQDILQRGDVILVEAIDKEGEYALRQPPEVNGAAIALDPHTGRVLAMVGGHRFGGRAFNRATQAKRQPGSAFKPFVYLTALEQGLTPSSIVVDAPVSISKGRGAGYWQPKNYGNKYYGPSPLRMGVEKSRNVMTVRLVQLIGLEPVLEVGKRFNIYESLPRTYAPILGAEETTLVRLATAYGMLINGGRKIMPSLVERIQDHTGKTLYRRDARACPGCIYERPQAVNWRRLKPPLLRERREAVTDPMTAYQIVSMLEGVVKRGTAVRAKKLGYPLAGKTGTTNDSKDAWFMGFSPDLVVGVYVGYDNPRTLGKRETGSSVALPVFIDIMREALAGTPPVPFRIPPGIRLVNIDRHTGQLPSPLSLPSDIITEAFRPGSEPTSSFGGGFDYEARYDYYNGRSGQGAPHQVTDDRADTYRDDTPYIDNTIQMYDAPPDQARTPFNELY